MVRKDKLQNTYSPYYEGIEAVNNGSESDQEHDEKEQLPVNDDDEGCPHDEEAQDLTSDYNTSW